MYNFSQDEISKLKNFLKDDGIKFFREIKEKYGKINCVFTENGIPHPVHFREGMQIRNFMRFIGFNDETQFDIIENEWVNFVEEAIK